MYIKEIHCDCGCVFTFFNEDINKTWHEEKISARKKREWSTGDIDCPMCRKNYKIPNPKIVPTFMQWKNFGYLRY